MIDRTRNRKKIRTSSSNSGQLLELSIDILGQWGDGVATWNDKKVFVPFALPGERVVALLEGKRGDGFLARLVSIEESSAERITPACGHFTHCGGCAVQEASDRLYESWKVSLLQNPLAQVGISLDAIQPLMRISPGNRRRVSFSFQRKAGQVLLGFNGRGSHNIIQLQECPQLTPELVALLPPTRELLQKYCFWRGFSDHDHRRH